MAMPSVEKLLDIGLYLSKEKDADRLFETIINFAMEITDCDSGTLYVLKDDALHFKVMVNKTFNQRSSGEAITLPPVPLSREYASSRAALIKRPINVPNVYADCDFNFTGTKRYDEMSGYRTVSMLTVPLEDEHDDVIGVLQLINATDGAGNIVPFTAAHERVVFSLASQATICLINHNYATEVTELLDSFVRVMSAAIDARSPYNANHTRNMVAVAERFVGWLQANGRFEFDEIRKRQLTMSIWLHDIGKLVVPLEVMDKASRLGARLMDVVHRFQVLRMQNEINYLRDLIDKDEFERRGNELNDMEELIRTANEAGFIQDETYAQLQVIGDKSGFGPDGEIPFLTNVEKACLAIRKGTLTAEERAVIESHVNMTRVMLDEMNFPKHFRCVPEWASSHHEHLNGKGYPHGLEGEAIPFEVRIISLLDVFDALTAKDRPYKPAMPLEKAFAILGDMAKHEQIDGSLLEDFINSKAWEV
jgi:HD-GYP domain-containing protein (c-di-GMP phosphodiesterase class II)